MKFSLKQKYLFLICLCLGFSVIAISSFFAISSSKTEGLISVSAKNISLIYSTSALKSKFAVQEAAWKNLLLKSNDAGSFKANKAALEKASTSIMESSKRLVNDVGPNEKSIATEFVKAQEALMKKHADAIAAHLTEKNFDSKKADAEIDNLADKAYEGLNTLSDMILENSQDQQIATVKGIKKVMTISLSLFGFFVLGMFVFSFKFVSKLSKQLGSIAESLANEGQEVAQTSVHINQASHELSQTADSQASAIQETSASIEQISAMLARSAENASKSQENAEQSQRTIVAGKASVEDMVTSMNQISASNEKIIEQSEANTRDLSEIVNIITEIDDKTKVINDIVFQTKLLSFNASVEAARAGESGKGFAVVAEEVGNLAQLSGNAARDIKSMLEKSISKVRSIADNSKSSIQTLIVSSKKTVEDGTHNATRCKQALDSIMADATEVQLLIAGILEGSKEQARGIEEVKKAIGLLDKSATSNNNAARESAVTASTLANRSKEMQSLVIELKKLVAGSQSTAARTDSNVGQYSESENAYSDHDQNRKAA